MIYIKILISICIILLTSIAGKIKGNKYKKRELILLDVKKLLKRIRIEINYTENKIKNIIEDSIIDLDKELKENIYNIESIKNINEKDKKIINEYLEKAGKRDLESENALLNQIEQEIEIQIDAAKEEKNTNLKLYEKLGALVGTLIVITII